MYCMKCGAKILDGYEFCMKCGMRISQTTETRMPQPVNTNAEKLKPLCGRYKSGYLFEDADRFVSIIADIMPEDEETVDLMYHCVGGSTGKYLRTLTGKAALTPDEVDGINQWVCEDTGLSGSKAKELTQNFMTLLDVPVDVPPSPKPAPAPEPKPMPRPTPAPAPAPQPAPETEGELSYTVLEDRYETVPNHVPLPQPVKKGTAKDAAIMLALSLVGFVVGAILIDYIEGLGVIAMIIAEIFLFYAIYIPCKGTKLTVEERSGRNGGRYLACTFKEKGNHKYAIAVDNCWIGAQVRPGFAFKINTTGTHRVMLIADYTKCQDYEEITIR